MGKGKHINAGLIAATSGASLTISTTAASLHGFLFYASAAAATLTIVDSGRTIISWSGAAAAVLNCQLSGPMACTAGLSVTNSGAGTYTVFYSV